MCRLLAALIGSCDLANRSASPVVHGSKALIGNGTTIGGRLVEKLEIGSKFKGSRTRELVMHARPITSPRLVTPRGFAPWTSLPMRFMYTPNHKIKRIA